jgi:hypothetical protein
MILQLEGLGERLKTSRLKTSHIKIKPTKTGN